MKYILIFSIAFLTTFGVFAQNGKTFIHVLSNHNNGQRKDNVTPSNFFQRADSSFLIFGTCRTGADRNYPVWQQYNRKGMMVSSNNHNVGYAASKYSNKFTFETSDSGVIHYGSGTINGALIKYDSKMKEEWRIVPDSNNSATNQLVEIEGSFFGFFYHDSLGKNRSILREISSNSGKIVREISLVDICSVCDTTFSDGNGIMTMNNRLFFRSIENPRDTYKDYKWRYFEVDSSLVLIGSGQLPFHIGYEISRPFKLSSHEKILFFQDSVNKNNNNVFYSIANSYKTPHNKVDFKDFNRSGKIYVGNEFYDLEQNLYLRASTCESYSDTLWEYCSEQLMMFDSEGTVVKRFPLNHKDTSGRYQYYTITNLQKTLDGGFAFTMQHPGSGSTTLPWYLVVTDSNMLVKGKPFWNKFYSGDTSKSVGLANSNGIEELHVYPNPTSSILTISAPNNQILSYTLLDLNGRQILFGEFSNKVLLDVSELNKGMYFLRLKSNENGLVETQKIIVER